MDWSWPQIRTSPTFRDAFGGSQGMKYVVMITILLIWWGTPSITGHGYGDPWESVYTSRLSGRDSKVRKTKYMCSVRTSLAVSGVVLKPQIYRNHMAWKEHHHQPAVEVEVQ